MLEKGRASPLPIDGHSEEIKKLSGEIQVEKDSTRLLILVKEFTRLLDEQHASKEPKPPGEKASPSAA